MPPSNLVDIDLELDILPIYKFPLIPNYDCSKATILIQKTVIVGMGSLPFPTWYCRKRYIQKMQRFQRILIKKNSKDLEKWQTFPLYLGDFAM